MSDAIRYLQKHADITLEDYESQFDNYTRLIGAHVPITPETKMLEVGTGTGWFPLMCKLRGLSCKGLEISPELVEHAKQFGRKYGVEPDIELGNVEVAAIGHELYDVVIAFSVFEHVQHWQLGLQRVYDALKPGGVLLFGSTNKFGPSGEFDFPLYGWLPDQWRYKLRVARQGPDIMKLGIDFNQFTYPALRRAFRKVGFRKIYDRVETGNPAYTQSFVRRQGLILCQKVPLVKHLALAFIDGTNFVCIK